MIKNNPYFYIFVVTFKRLVLEWNNVLLAFGLTLFAGMATSIGGALAFFARRTNTTFLSFSLGFSAGVMIYISFTEILGDSMDIISFRYGEDLGSWITFIAFIFGFFLTAMIDKVLPSKDNPHEVKSIEQMDIHCPKQGRKLLRVGTFTIFLVTTI